MRNLIFTLCLFLCFIACRDDDDAQSCQDEANPACENYDPCWDRRMPVSADFSFGVIGGTIDTTFLLEVPDGQFVNDANVYFQAKDETADSYLWKIGSDTREFAEPFFSIRFQSDVPKETPIEIQLITERLLDTNCVEDASILSDTFSRAIVFRRPENWSILGKYLGHLESNPNNTFEIEIAPPHPPEDEKDLNIYNLLNHGCPIVDISGLKANSEVFSSGRFSHHQTYRDSCTHIDYSRIPIPEGEYSGYRFRDYRISLINSKELTLHFQIDYFSTKSLDSCNVYDIADTFRGTKL